MISKCFIFISSLLILGCCKKDNGPVNDAQIAANEPSKKLNIKAPIKEARKIFVCHDIFKQFRHSKDCDTEKKEWRVLVDICNTHKQCCNYVHLWKLDLLNMHKINDSSLEIINQTKKDCDQNNSESCDLLKIINGTIVSDDVNNMALKCKTEIYYCYLLAFVNNYIKFNGDIKNTYEENLCEFGGPEDCLPLLSRIGQDYNYMRQIPNSLMEKMCCGMGSGCMYMTMRKYNIIYPEKLNRNTEQLYFYMTHFEMDHPLMRKYCKNSKNDRYCNAYFADSPENRILPEECNDQPRLPNLAGDRCKIVNELLK